MFTGIVEELGTVEAIEDRGAAIRLTMRADQVLADAALGDSIAVNGCCLTVSDRTGTTWTADVMQETLDKTSLATAGPGDPVNLERAMAASSRFGGHIVQGHVDGTATILERTPGDRWEVVRFDLPDAIARYVVEKGSITVDGVSLTVSALDDQTFSVSLIPTTLALTTLGRKAVGDRVNLEVDVLAKYVERLITSKENIA